MSEVVRIDHPLRRSYRVDDAEFYIDHFPHRSIWSQIKQWAREKSELLRARYKLFKESRDKDAREEEALRRQLRRTGLSGIDLLKSEVRHIGKFIHKGEELLASMSGRNDDGGNALMVVTDSRIIYLDIIPLFTRLDEISYDLVAGVSTEVGMLSAKVTLHTGIKDFTLHSVDPGAAAHFVGVIELIDVGHKALEAIPAT